MNNFHPYLFGALSGACLVISAYLLTWIAKLAEENNSPALSTIAHIFGIAILGVPIWLATKYLGVDFMKGAGSSFMVVIAIFWHVNTTRAPKDGPVTTPVLVASLTMTFFLLAIAVIISTLPW